MSSTLGRQTWQALEPPLRQANQNQPSTFHLPSSIFRLPPGRPTSLIACPLPIAVYFNLVALCLLAVAVAIAVAHRPSPVRRPLLVTRSWHADSIGARRWRITFVQTSPSPSTCDPIRHPHFLMPNTYTHTHAPSRMGRSTDRPTK